MKSAPRIRPAQPLTLERLSDAALEASIAETLKGWNARHDLWLFGYGSLMWNLGCEYSQRIPARVFGYHRSFCLWSRINRGTPEAPGLVLALERGGSCAGFAFRIPRECVGDFMLPLWRREMQYGSYHPRWLACHTQKGVRKALGFAINPHSNGYCGHLDEEDRVECIVQGRGIYGTSADYLFNTVQSLEELGIRDHGLQRLAERVRARLGQP